MDLQYGLDCNKIKKDKERSHTSSFFLSKKFRAFAKYIGFFRRGWNKV